MFTQPDSAASAFFFLFKEPPLLLSLEWKPKRFVSVERRSLISDSCARELDSLFNGNLFRLRNF